MSDEIIMMGASGVEEEKVIVYRKILVPLDGSEASERAFQHALYLAKLTGAQVTLLHVIDLNRKMSMLERSMAGGYIPSEFKEQAYQRLISYRRQTPEDIAVDMLVEIGAPAERIVDIAEHKGFSLVVMGSRGLGAFQDFMLGGVSHYVLHRCHVPVLVVR